MSASGRSCGAVPPPSAGSAAASVLSACAEAISAAPAARSLCSDCARAPIPALMRALSSRGLAPLRAATEGAAGAEGGGGRAGAGTGAGIIPCGDGGLGRGRPGWEPAGAGGGAAISRLSPLCASVASARGLPSERVDAAARRRAIGSDRSNFARTAPLASLGSASSWPATSSPARGTSPVRSGAVRSPWNRASTPAWPRTACATSWAIRCRPAGVSGRYAPAPKNRWRP